MSSEVQPGAPDARPSVHVTAEADRSAIRLDTSHCARWNRLALPHLFERGGLERDKPAIVFQSRSRSYGELRARMRRIAQALVGVGLRPYERVALIAGNRLEYIEIEAGIAAACGIMVPVNWRLKPGEVAAILRRSGARAILADAAAARQIQGLRDQGAVPDLEILLALDPQPPAATWLDFEALVARAPEDPVARSPRLDDPHEIIFTSGTTGLPKGVVWSNGGLLFNSLQQVVDFRLGPESSSYATIDLYYIGGRHDFTWSVLHAGGTVHVKPSGGFDAEAVLRYTCEQRISHILWVPTMLYELLRVPDPDRFDTRHLRTIMCGGQPLAVDVIRAIRRRFPQTDFVQVYGLTEGGGSVTCMPAHMTEVKPGSAGRPSAHVALRICDDDGRDCPADVDGEIWVRAPSMTAGYWDDPALTEATLADDWLRTGDMGRLDDDGYLYVTGRKKDMIISGGMNIFPAEIEDVLRTHPDVADAAVIGVPHEKWGEQVCAVVETLPGRTADPAELVAHCTERLAGYKKPSIVHVLDQLPRTSSGKPQKFVLRERFGAGGRGPGGAT